MKQKQGLLFTIALLFFLIFAAFLFKINGKSIFGYQIKFVSSNDFKKTSLKTDDSLVDNADNPDKNDKNTNFVWPAKCIEFPLKSDIEIQNYVDGLIAGAKDSLNETAFKESPFLVNAPINGKYPLDAFFENLNNIPVTHKLLRVGHYGDSQIEGDRMTNIFRKLFQSRFGGNGVGYLPMDDVTSPVSYTRRSDANWTRYTVFKNKLSGFAYGPGGSSYRYAPATSATISLNLLSSYQKATILYGFGSDDSYLEVYTSGNQLLGKLALNQKSVFNKVQLPLSSNEMSLRLVFTGNSPCIYGLTFDPLSGIQFDNFGLRGQAGDGLLTIPKNQLVNMIDQTDTKMAVLQFGGNVVPGLRTEKMLNIYGDIYKKLYLYFKESVKSGSILIIGVNDVSRSVSGVYRSYPNISELRYIQRKIAVENGLAFFDVYQFMGGENSIKTWNEKSLSSRDGHYSDKGRDIVCKELYKALIFEYNEFLKRKALVKK